MSKLLQKPVKKEVAEGVTVVQAVTKGNSPLEFVEFKIVELAPCAEYTELLNKTECCIVALTGKINVAVGENV